MGGQLKGAQGAFECPGDPPIEGNETGLGLSEDPFGVDGLQEFYGNLEISLAKDLQPDGDVVVNPFERLLGDIKACGIQALGSQELVAQGSEVAFQAVPG